MKGYTPETFVFTTFYDTFDICIYNIITTAKALLNSSSSAMLDDFKR